ncbi:MAG: pyridoxal phosphate-dependent aminotransferase [Chloroflexota bacterium]
MQFASRVHRTVSEGAPAWGVHAQARKMMGQGKDVILLTIGDPDFDTSDEIIDVTVKSLRSGRTHYTPLMGEEPFRRAIAQYHSDFTGQPVDAENVIAVVGAQCGLYAASMCILNPGDQVIVLDPTYSTYAYFLGAAGAETVYVSLRPERNFQVDPDDVANAITQRTKAILLNTPHNPTGAMVHRAEMDALASLCQQHDLWMITDEVYGPIAFEQPHISAGSLANMAERTVTISSLSKSHAMTGWRIGWAVGPQELIKHIGNLFAGMLFGAPPFIQDAATHALTARLDEATIMRNTYKARRDLVFEHLQEAPKVSCHLPEGGMYMMLDIRETGMNATDFGYKLLDKEKVALLPGDAFGPGGAGHMRLSLTLPEEKLIEACERTVRFAQSV